MLIRCWGSVGVPEYQVQQTLKLRLEIVGCDKEIRQLKCLPSLRNTERVSPTFIAILNELKPSDAVYIKAIHRRVMDLIALEHQPFFEIRLDIIGLKQIYDKAVLDVSPPEPGTTTAILVDTPFRTTIDILVRHGILTPRTEPQRAETISVRGVAIPPKPSWSLSSLGFSFVLACEPPTMASEQ
jgi:hypothetical protein